MYRDEAYALNRIFVDALRECLGIPPLYCSKEEQSEPLLLAWEQGKNPPSRMPKYAWE